jgi:hypothetical protein
MREAVYRPIATPYIIEGVYRGGYRLGHIIGGLRTYIRGRLYMGS